MGAIKLQPGTGEVYLENGTTTWISDAVHNAVDLSDCIKTIDIDHAVIHEGKGFAAFLVQENLANGQKIDIAMVTGQWPIHLKEEKVEISNSFVEIELHEDTARTGGTLISSAALNRINVKTPGFELYQGATVDFTGSTELLSHIVRAGEPNEPAQRSRSVVDNTFEEWILKPNSEYAFTIANNSGSSISMVEIFWYWYTAGRE